MEEVTKCLLTCALTALVSDRRGTMSRGGFPSKPGVPERILGGLNTNAEGAGRSGAGVGLLVKRIDHEI